MKKILQILAWLSGGFGVLMMLLGGIAVLAGGILWAHWWENYFYPGVGFVVLGIFLHVGSRVCGEKS